MKTVYKFLTLGALALSLGAINVTSTFAQEDEKTTMYNAFVACYKETDTAKRDTCYAGAKQYLDKYEKSADGTVDQYGAFVRKKYDAYVANKQTEATFGTFDASIKDSKNINADNAFSSGKTIIAGNPDLIDVPIVLASIGFDNAALATPNDKYNADAVNYAKMVIDKINQGKTSKQYGAYQYTYQTPKYPDGKSNTLGWMNYTIGYIMYYRQNQKKEALPYLYKATQINGSETKNNFRIYAAIGKWYVDEFARLDADRVAKVKAAGDQDTDETKAIFAMQKGYAERAAEAYSRAYKLAVADTTATKENRDGLMNVSKQFYGIRFNNDATKFDGYDAYVAGLTSKTFTDPTMDVIPVAEPVPAATTTTSGTAATTTTVKPAATTTTTTKPATTTTKPATTTTTTTPTKKPTATTPAKPSTKTTAKKGAR